jgi:hypothetical protein
MEQRVLWDKYVGEAETKLKAAACSFVAGGQAGVLQGDAADPATSTAPNTPALIQRIRDTK